MTDLIVWSGDGLTPPATPTPFTTATTGTGDTTPDSVTGDIYLDDKGSYTPAILVDQADGVSTFIYWSFTPTKTLAFRCYIYLTGHVGSSWQLIRASKNGSTQAFRVAVSGTGTTPPSRLRILDDTNAMVKQSSGGLPINKWLRLEGVLDSGFLTLKAFSPFESMLSVAEVSFAVGSDDVGVIQMGSYGSNSPAVPDLWIDEILFTDDNTFIGAKTPGSGVYSVKFWDGTNEHDIHSIALWDGSDELPAHYT